MTNLIDKTPTMAAATSDTPRFKLREFNRKIPAPSRRMSLSDGNHYRCSWIEDSLTIHSDGNVSCGLDDPHSQRTFGNIYTQSISDIFDNPEFANLQAKLWNGHRCMDCALYQREKENFSAGINPRPALPSTLVIEPTVRCNIRCPNGIACAANNDPAIKTRDRDMLDFDALANVIDQLANVLRYVYFFNYGDPFVHARAEEMLMYIRQRCPAAQIITSTNGIPLAKRERAMKVVESNLDFITFTIGGMSQESYSRYHVGGRLDLALSGLRNVADAKRELGLTRPTILWRYLLFRWNDSDEEIEKACSIAREFGIDQLILYLTHIPAEGASFRFAPGTFNYAKYRDLMDCALHFDRVSGIPQANADGFYSVDNIAELGRSYWTSWRARKSVSGHLRWLHLSLSTNRPISRMRPCVAFVITNWKIYKVPLHCNVWTDMTIRIPDEHRGSQPINIEIITFDFWFPIEEAGTSDPRCLGVLVRADEPLIDDAGAMLRSERTEQLAPPNDAELRKLQAAPPFRSNDMQMDNGGRYW